RQFLSRFFNVFNELAIFMTGPSEGAEHRQRARRSQCRGSRLFLLAPALLAAAADIAGAHPLFQESRGAEPLAIGVEQDLRGLQHQARGRCVHQLERTHRVARPSLQAVSMSSGVATPSSTSRTASCKKIRNMRLTAKPATSLTRIGILPASRQSRIAVSTVSGAVSKAGITSTSFIREAGEK